MHGYIYIKRNDHIIKFETTDYYRIYDFLINNGYSHIEAEDIANWAEFASIGDKYETEQPDAIYVQW